MAWLAGDYFLSRACVRAEGRAGEQRTENREQGVGFRVATGDWWRLPSFTYYAVPQRRPFIHSLLSIATIHNERGAGITGSRTEDSSRARITRPE